jgi:DNA-binding PadR family transcriptional regulator
MRSRSLLSGRPTIFFRIKEGSLFPALQRMLKASCVAAELGLSPRNRRVRILQIDCVWPEAASA